VRTRDMAIGQYVKVRSYATGKARDLRDLVGTLTEVWPVSSEAAVKFPGRGVEMVEARWLEASSTPPPPVDPPELAEYKRRLTQVAQKYARANGLCDVVDDFLREMGAEPRKPGKVRLVFEIDEDVWNDYVEGSADEGTDVLDGAVNTFGNLLASKYPSQRVDYLKSATFIDAEEDK